jgi:hypothetical protein
MFVQPLNALGSWKKYKYHYVAQRLFPGHKPILVNIIKFTWTTRLGTHFSYVSFKYFLIFYLDVPSNFPESNQSVSIRTCFSVTYELRLYTLFVVKIVMNYTLLRKEVSWHYLTAFLNVCTYVKCVKFLKKV